MTYQGARARPQETEFTRVFAVSGVILDATGRVTNVRWKEIDSKSNLDVGPEVLVVVEEVIDALHDGASVVAIFPNVIPQIPPRAFELVEHASGSEALVLAKMSQEPVAGSELRDLALAEQSLR